LGHIIPWNFSVIPEKFMLFRDAALLTLEITTLGILTGLVIGLFIALGKLSPLKPISRICSS